MSNSNYKSGGPQASATLDNGAGVERGQRRYGNDFDESKVSRAADGKFGHGGTTRSGKKVSADHAKGEGYTPSDHKDAEAVHRKIAAVHGDQMIDHFDTPRGHAHGDSMEHHQKLADQHGKAAQFKTKKLAHEEHQAAEQHAATQKHDVDADGDVTHEGKKVKRAEQAPVAHSGLGKGRVGSDSDWHGEGPTTRRSTGPGM